MQRLFIIVFNELILYLTHAFARDFIVVINIIIYLFFSGGSAPNCSYNKIAIAIKKTRKTLVKIIHVCKRNCNLKSSPKHAVSLSYRKVIFVLKRNKIFRQYFNVYYYEIGFFCNK